MPTPTVLIKGGQVFDPASRSFADQDIGIASGRVVRIARAIEAAPGVNAIDATGKIVTPGLIDSHVHAYYWGTRMGIDVDRLSSRTGVTTFVDAGSTGALNFLGFRRFVIERTQANLFALLHVSAIGVAFEGIPGLTVGDSDDLRLLHLPAAVETIEANRDVIVGVKVRMYRGLTSLVPIAIARELADEVGLPLVVHTDAPPPTFRDIAPYLRPGDVITHVLRPGPGAILDRSGRVREEFKAARSKGVIIDTGIARLFLSFPVARAVIEQDFAPDTISTDLTAINMRGLTVDLPTTLNKFMALGLRLEDVLARVTEAPARVYLKGQSLGQMVEGMPADLAIFSIEEGEFTYNDFFGHTVRATRRIAHHRTIKGGELLAPMPSLPGA